MTEECAKTWKPLVRAPSDGLLKKLSSTPVIDRGMRGNTGTGDSLGSGKAGTRLAARWRGAGPDRQPGRTWACVSRGVPGGACVRARPSCEPVSVSARACVCVSDCVYGYATEADDGKRGTAKRNGRRPARRVGGGYLPDACPDRFRRSIAFAGDRTAARTPSLLGVDTTVTTPPVPGRRSTTGTRPRVRRRCGRRSTGGTATAGQACRW